MKICFNGCSGQLSYSLVDSLRDWSKSLGGMWGLTEQFLGCLTCRGWSEFEEVSSVGVADRTGGFVTVV